MDQLPSLNQSVGERTWVSHWTGLGHVPIAGANQCHIQPHLTLNSEGSGSHRKIGKLLRKLGRNYNRAGRKKAGFLCSQLSYYFKIIFCLIFIGVDSFFSLSIFYLYSVNIICIYPLFLGFPTSITTAHQVEFSVLYNGFLVVTYFMHVTVSLFDLISHSFQLLDLLSSVCVCFTNIF